MPKTKKQPQKALRPKKRAAKKPVRRVRTLRAAASAPVFSFLNPAALAQETTAFDFSEPRATRSFPLLARMPAVPAPTAAPRPTRVPVSPHVIDLKAIAAEREAARAKQIAQSRPLVERAFSGVIAQQEALLRSAQSAVSVPAISRTVTKAVTRLPRFTLPKLPSLTLPALPAFALPPRWKESLAVFVLLAFAFTLPFQGVSYLESAGATKGTVLGVTASALEHLRGTQDALGARDLYAASKELDAASHQLTVALEEYRTMDNTLVAIAKRAPLVGGQLSSAESLMAAAQRVTQRSAVMADRIAGIKNAEGSLTAHWKPVADDLGALSTDIDAAAAALQGIRSDLVPEDVAPALDALARLLPRVAASVREMHALADYILQAAGAASPQRYLILFQNNNELRATGGFIGSYAFVEVNKGAVTKLEVPGGGSYDLQGGLKSWIKSPKPLRAIEDRWQFHDANWFFDFPTSARTLTWFYEQSGGTTVDGVIAINATVLERMINLTGPVTLDAYGKTFTKDTVISQLQQAVEFEYDKAENKPKQIIADLLPVVLERLLSVTDIPAAAQSFADLMRAHDIQIYHADPSLESFIADRGWSGALVGTAGDYLAVVSTNIAGGKTDAVMEQSASLGVAIGDDGSVTNTLTITKHHTDTSGDRLSGITNVDYLRVYVPEGSTLVSAEGFNPPAEESLAIDDTDMPLQDYPELLAQHESMVVDAATRTEIYPESGKTVFANWIHTKPGESRTVRLTYRLPFTVQLPEKTSGGDLLQALRNGGESVGAYSLYIQKQSGKRPFPIDLTIAAPADYRTPWSYPGADGSLTLDRDLLIGRMFTR